MYSIVREFSNNPNTSVRTYILKKESEPNVMFFGKTDVNEHQKLYLFPHPHIIRTHGVHNISGKNVSVMDYFDGGELSEWDLFDYEHRNVVMEQLTSVLRLISQKGYAYVDLKPQNVLFDGLEIRLIDFDSIEKFGLADETTRCSECFCAPEILTAREITPNSVVYSFGLTILASMHCSRLDAKKLKKMLLFSPESLIPQELPKYDQRLLTDMIKVNPRERCSIEEVYERLK